MIATVCSEWAVREPSAERMVQPSGSKTIRSVVRANQGSSARVMPGSESEPAAGAALVGDVGIFVHRSPEPVAAELGVDRVAVGGGDRLDRRRDVAEPVAWRRGRDAGGERFLGRAQESQVVVGGRAHDDGAGGVGDPAVDPDREVHAEHVPVAQCVVVRQAVEHRVVDRQAGDVAERAVAERRGVVPVATRSWVPSHVARWYFNTNIALVVLKYQPYSGGVVRNPLTPEQIEAGRRLGALLREARAERDLGDVAHAAGMSPETLRKIETGRLPTPAFGTIACLSEVLDLPIQDLAAAWRNAPRRLEAAS